MIRNTMWGVVSALLLATAPVAPGLAQELPTYQALHHLQPDGGRLPVEDLALERDAFRFRFVKGSFYFLTPVAGRTVGAVFVGSGTLELSPSDQVTARHLAELTGRREPGPLTTSFDHLILLFTDDTARELRIAAPVETAPPSADATRLWSDHLARQDESYPADFFARLLQDLLNQPGLTSGVFLAFLPAGDLPAGLAAVDPRGAEALRLFSRAGTEDSVFYAWDDRPWYLSRTRLEVTTGRSVPTPRLVDVTRYRVEARVGDRGIEGTVVAEGKAVSDGVRLVPVDLDLRLRVTAASLDAGEGGSGRQPAELAPPGRPGNSAVVLPRALAKDEAFRLRLTFSGEGLLTDLGAGNRAIDAEEGWYPSLGAFSDPAVYELALTVPGDEEVVASGSPTGQRTQGNATVWSFETAAPIRSVGFALGHFKERDGEDEVGGVKVAVYSGLDTPQALEELDQEIAEAEGTSLTSGLSAAALGESGFEPTSGSTPTSAGPDARRVSLEDLAEAAVIDSVNLSRVASTYFGPPPLRRWVVGQGGEKTGERSWPGLVLIPHLGLLTPELSTRLGRSGASTTGYHELAHQWWGLGVGYGGCRDEWFEEGLAELTAALVQQHASGWPVYLSLLSGWQRSLAEPPADGKPALSSAAPLSLGAPLVAPDDAGRYETLMRHKGAFVFHMLRMAMWDRQDPNPDHLFIDMLEDFATTFAGANPTTADLKRVVEKHMVPEMNATGDGKMDWFFDQWVHGTEIPRYHSDLKVVKAGSGKYTVRGSVQQLDVSQSFRALVPVYLDFGKGKVARIGVMPMIGPATVPIDLTLEAPKKPRGALINARREVLARD